MKIKCGECKVLIADTKTKEYKEYLKFEECYFCDDCENPLCDSCGKDHEC